MKKLLSKISLSALTISLFIFLFSVPNILQPTLAGNVATGLSATSTGCGANGNVSVTFNWTPADNPVIVNGTPLPVVEQILDFSVYDNNFSAGTFQGHNVGVGSITKSFTDTFVPGITYYWRISTSYYPGGPGSFTFSSTRNFVPTCSGSGGGSSTSLGTIEPPAGIPNPADATEYTAGFIRNAVSLLIMVAFIAMLLWTIFAGFRFVTSGGDEKTVSQSWSSIYWGIVGMLIVVGSYAIVKLVETFFNVNILSGGLVLP